MFLLIQADLTAPADVGILIASSPQTTQTKWSSILDDVNSVVDAFPISQRGTHLSVATVGKVPKLALKFNTLRGSDYNLNEVKRRISQIPYEKVETTRLDLGLQKAADEMFATQSGMRTEASKVSNEMLHHLSLFQSVMLSKWHVPLNMMWNHRRKNLPCRVLCCDRILFNKSAIL